MHKKISGEKCFIADFLFYLVILLLLDIQQFYCEDES